jgi:ribose 5-phosphate isomerase B
MVIFIGSDHGGFALKESLKQTLEGEGYQITDVGAKELVADDDFPDYAAKVGLEVSRDPQNVRGILICRSGFGMDIAANKFHGVRAALPMSPDHLYQGRHDDDVNVLILAADYMDDMTALQFVRTFLTTPYANEERYARRIAKIDTLENT